MKIPGHKNEKLKPSDFGYEDCEKVVSLKDYKKKKKKEEKEKIIQEIVERAKNLDW